VSVYIIKRCLSTAFFDFFSENFLFSQNLSFSLESSRIQIFDFSKKFLPARGYFPHLPATILPAVVLYYKGYGQLCAAPLTKGELFMPHDIDHNTAAQRRTSKLLAAMAIFICLGIVAYIILTLLVNRQTPANPDTHYTGTNGVSVYYDSSIWKVCQMTEDSTLGTVLELATADSADGAEDYQAVLLQRGTADTYPDFIDDSEKDLKQAYGIIKPRTANITVEGAEVTAVRCDIQTYYAVLATITYDSGDVVYVSALTKLASINDIVNLVESVSLS
jgi:hypothetical protein